MPERFRLGNTAFTRQRCLTLPRMAGLMLSGLCASVQAELDGFFSTLGLARDRIRQVSAQAFSKARRGFSATLFSAANAHLVSVAESHWQRFAWQGLRPVAADASRLQVATRAGAELQPDHYAFALFLPGPELTLHASLHAVVGGCERQMLFEALEHLRPGQDLLLLDRGYPAAWLVALLKQRGIDFCMRVDATGWNCVKAFLASGEAERRVRLPRPPAKECAVYEVTREAVEVRLIRDLTPEGNVRVLMTSLLDAQRYVGGEFGHLYHRRWRVEEAFKRIKHRLRLEACSGLTYLALQQDFAAKVLADNLFMLVADSADLADHELDGIDSATRRSRPNRTYALGALKPVIVGCLFAVRGARAALRRALEAVLNTRCRDRKTRKSYPRPPRKKPHLCATYRPVR